MSISDDERGALPEELRDVDTGRMVVSHERRLSNAETTILDIRAASARLDDHVLKLVSEVHGLRLEITAAAAERRAVDGMHSAYVRPVVVAVLIGALTLAGATLVTRTENATAQAIAREAAAEVLRAMGERKSSP